MLQNNEACMLTINSATYPLGLGGNLLTEAYDQYVYLHVDHVYDTLTGSSEIIGPRANRISLVPSLSSLPSSAEWASGSEPT